MSREGSDLGTVAASGSLGPERSPANQQWSSSVGAGYTFAGLSHRHFQVFVPEMGEVCWGGLLREVCWLLRVMTRKDGFSSAPRCCWVQTEHRELLPPCLLAA